MTNPTVAPQTSTAAEDLFDESNLIEDDINEKDETMDNDVAKAVHIHSFDPPIAEEYNPITMWS